MEPLYKVGDVLWGFDFGDLYQYKITKVVSKEGYDDQVEYDYYYTDDDAYRLTQGLDLYNTKDEAINAELKRIEALRN